jgi:hypothetical protein
MVFSPGSGILVMDLPALLLRHQPIHMAARVTISFGYA